MGCGVGSRCGFGLGCGLEAWAVGWIVTEPLRLTCKIRSGVRVVQGLVFLIGIRHYRHFRTGVAAAAAACRLEVRRAPPSCADGIPLLSPRIRGSTCIFMPQLPLRALRPLPCDLLHYLRRRSVLLARALQTRERAWDEARAHPSDSERRGSLSLQNAQLTALFPLRRALSALPTGICTRPREDGHDGVKGRARRWRRRRRARRRSTTRSRLTRTSSTRSLSSSSLSPSTA